MKKILEQWTGKFLIGKEIKTNLNDWNPKHGEKFRVKLLTNRRK